jgi:predicted ATP-binding protein involved in virulence
MDRAELAIIVTTINSLNLNTVKQPAINILDQLLYNRLNPLVLFYDLPAKIPIINLRSRLDRYTIQRVP